MLAAANNSLNANEVNESVIDEQRLKIEIGERVRKLREERGHSSLTLSEALKKQYPGAKGFNSTGILDAETGHKRLSIFHLICLAHFFDVPITYFTHGDSERTYTPPRHSETYKLNSTFKQLRAGSTLLLQPFESLKGNSYYLTQGKNDVELVYVEYKSRKGDYIFHYEDIETSPMSKDKALKILSNSYTFHIVSACLDLNI